MGKPALVDREFYYNSDESPGFLSGIWRFRHLLATLVVRDIRVKYQHSILGFAWTLLAPAAMVGVLVAVFTRFVRLGIDGYWAFLISGFFLWNFFALVLGTAATLLVSHAGLRRSVVFPGEVLIVGSVATSMIEFTLELLIVISVIAVFHHGGIPASYLFLPLLLLLSFAMAVGLGLVVATTSCFFDDVRHGLPLVLRIGFYASPIFYPISMVPESIRPFYMLNPAAHLLTLYHTVFYEGEMPSFQLIGTNILVVAAIVAVSYRIFGRYKSDIVELA